LDQHVHFKSGSTVHESALAAFGRLQQIEHEMHELEHRMADAGDELEKILERYSDLQQEFEHEGGFEYAAKAESILQGLGFDREMWTMETEKLSGGQQNRLGLACLLLAAPDVLLLDEPTNHLDVNAVEWLEEFLQTYPAAIVIISHDRYFLDRSCRRIIELENGRAASYTGNYSDFLVEREERREAQQRAYDNQQQLIAKTQEFIRRNIAGQKTKQAKSRRKMLEKLERIDAVRRDQSSGDFRLGAIERTGNHVLTVNELSIGYDTNLLARNIALPHGRRLSRFGLIGRRREQEAAKPIADDLRVKATPTQPVRLLSGGNQQKVVLGKWLAGEVRLFIFDEPTRGIDVGSKVEIYLLMNRLTARGAGILMISSELPELLGMSDRILVMHRGRIEAEIDRAQATEERVLTAALGLAG